MVISTMGIPPLATAWAANSASWGEDTRMPEMMPTSAMRARTSSRFIDLPFHSCSSKSASGSGSTSFGPAIHTYRVGSRKIFISMATMSPPTATVSDASPQLIEVRLGLGEHVVRAGDPHVQSGQQENIHQHGHHEPADDDNREGAL